MTRNAVLLSVAPPYSFTAIHLAETFKEIGATDIARGIYALSAEARRY